MMTNDWVKSVNLDIFECAKQTRLAGKQLRQKAIGEYDTASLHPPYRVTTLMLNRIFGRENGKWYKLSWIPLIYHVALEGTIFNWADIVASSLSSCIVATQGGLTQRNS